MSAEPSHRIKGLDGLRAIAVFGVFLMHKTAIGERYGLGDYGVWLFFLISGFLITSQLVNSRDKVEANRATAWQEMRSFWLRRSFRILPPYYALLAVLTAIYAAHRREAPGLLWHWGYATNWFIGLRTHAWIGTWGHFWSLAIEEQFYAVFAPLILLFRRTWAPWTCAIVLIVGVGARLWMFGHGAPAIDVYVNSFVNFGTLALGGLAGFAARRTPLKGQWFGWTALTAYLAMPFAAVSLGVPVELVALLAFAVGLMVLLNVTAEQDGTLTRLLSLPPVAYFGRISYGFYLFQSYIPVDLVGKFTHRSGILVAVASAAVAFVLAFVWSALSFEFFEMPVQRWGRKHTLSRILPEPALRPAE